jgi:hypothetical protein
MADEGTAEQLAKRGLISPDQMAVMSDANANPVRAGDQLAQGSPYQIRTNGGQHQVINVQTGQVHYTGTASGAANAQASLNYRNR